MADNETIDNGALTDYHVATDKVTHSGDADRNVQIIRQGHVTGAEGSKTVENVTQSTGSAVPPAAVMVGGTDGTNARFFKVDANGELQIDVLSLPALAAGNANIGDVDIASGPTGTSALQGQGTAASDAAVVGNPLLSGGRASSAVPTAMSADGDAVARWLDRSGGTVINGRDAHDAALDSNTNPQLIGGRSSAAAPTDVSADGDAVRAWFLRNGAQSVVLTAAGALIGGDATNGLDVDVTRLPGAAHDAAIAGNPVRIGARALSADFTAVATGDTADLITSLLGKLINLPYCLPAASEKYASPSAVTDTADDEAFAAGGTNVRHYITGCQIFNGHDTVGTEVVIKDGSTVMFRGWAEEKGGGVSVKFDPPLRGTANTAVNVANITTGSSTYFNLQGYTATND